MNFSRKSFQTLILVGILIPTLATATSVDHSKLNLEKVDDAASVDAAPDKAEKPQNTAALPKKPEAKPDDGSKTVLDLTRLDVNTASPKLSLPKNAVSYSRDAEGNAVANDAKLQEASTGTDQKGTPLSGGPKVTQVTRGKVDRSLASKDMDTTKYDDGCRGKKFRKSSDKEGMLLVDTETGEKYPVTEDNASKWDPAQLKNTSGSGQIVDAADIGTQFNSYKVYRIRQSSDPTAKQVAQLDTTKATYYSTNNMNVNNPNAQLTALGVNEKGCFDLGGGGGGQGQDGTTGANGNTPAPAPKK